MTLEEIKLTEKYLNEYTEYCKNRECGEDCPVFQLHQQNKAKSCFMQYCQLREHGLL